MSTLVIGAAGYIGSHVSRLLREREKLFGIDDFSTGLASRVAGFPMIEQDITAPGAEKVLVDVMREEKVDSVIHLAAKKRVDESVANPAYYYKQNVGGLAAVLAAMERAHVRKLVFSSSAAVYGNLTRGRTERVTEADQCVPVSPYGETKLVGEWMCRDAERAWGLSWVGLRYFNVAGCGWPDLADTGVLNLIPIVFSRLSRGLPPVVFGNDYETPDGTCVRDYIHVLDLARAHIAALDVMGRDTPCLFNVGTGQGASVLEVLRAISAATGRDTSPDVLGRRQGDPAVVVADPGLLRQFSGWRPVHSLDEIVGSAWQGWLKHDASFVNRWPGADVDPSVEHAAGHGLSAPISWRGRAPESGSPEQNAASVRLQ